MKILGHDLHTLTGAYALNAIHGRERVRFERHLDTCQSCEHEVRGMQETATRLAVAVARVPPPELKVAVMTAAAHTRQHPPLIDVRPQPVPHARRRPQFGLAMATAMAVVAALAVVLGVQQDRLDHARSQQHQVAAAQQRQLDQVQTQQHQVAAVLNSPDAKIVTASTSRGGTVTAVVAGQQHAVVLTAAGLPALSGARVYQFWLIGKDHTTSAGLLSKTALLADHYQRGDRIGVTIEPAGGTQQPTTTPIAMVSLRSA